jgi:hypothetical protein
MVQDEKESQKIFERNRVSRLEEGGGLEGFQTDVCLRGRVDGIYSTCDVRTFHATITLWYGESKQMCSRFRYHAHRQLHSICFACEADYKILF